MTSELPDGTPQVSVLMACRDGLPFLGQALDSLAAQTMDSWELLLVDGGSSDGSADVARRYGPRVRIVPAPDGPQPGAARNRGAALARAPLLAFLDADDRWRRDKLERQVALQRRSGAVLVYSDCNVVDRAGTELGRYLSRHRPVRGAVGPALLRENFVPLSTVLVTRSAFQQVGGFPPGYWAAADYAFALRVAAVGDFEYEMDALADYRIHGGNLTRDFRMAYRENVQLYRTLLASAGPGEEEGRAREALAALYWRWAMREAASGAFGGALGLAGEALAVVGPLQAPRTLRDALAYCLRGLPVRLRMARARRAAAASD